MSIHVEINDGVGLALEELTVDQDFDFSSMQRQWHRFGALSPKQAALVIWRLQHHGIAHDPAGLGLRIATRDGDREQIAAMEGWQRDRLVPYLTAEQRTELGI